MTNDALNNNDANGRKLVTGGFKIAGTPTNASGSTLTTRKRIIMDRYIYNAIKLNQKSLKFQMHSIIYGDFSRLQWLDSRTAPTDWVVIKQNMMRLVRFLTLNLGKSS